MSVIEMRTMEIICRNLPEIANQLKRIADELESQRKENDDAKTTVD